MPNYKICRFCPEKYIQITDEEICPACKDAVIRAAESSPFDGEPIIGGTISDPVAEAMRKAVEDAHPKVAEVIAPIVETTSEVVAPIVAEIVEATPKDLQKEKDIADMEEAIVELTEEENAEIIAPSAPKPEDKPDAPT